MKRQSLHHAQSNSAFEQLKSLLPSGTRGTFTSDNAETDNDYHWSQHPRWPPDLFAIAATILDRYDGHTIMVRGSTQSGDYELNHIISNAKEIGSNWANILTADEELEGDEYEGAILENYDRWISSEKQLETLWTSFIHKLKDVYKSDNLSDKSYVSLNSIALQLFIIADEASEGLGFYRDSSWLSAIYTLITKRMTDPKICELLRNQKSDFWMFSIIEEADKIIEDILSGPQKTSQITTCILVTANEVCVQPKIKVPDPGFTLRTMSKNLALLPPTTKVKVNWNPPFGNEQKSEQPFNILAIPYPFTINGNAFCANEAQTASDSLRYSQRLFNLNETWLYERDKCNYRYTESVSSDPHPKTSKSLVNMVRDLIKLSRDHVQKIDMILFPELALDHQAYNKIGEMLAKGIEPIPENDPLTFFISGVVFNKDNLKHNNAFTSVITDRKKNPDLYYRTIPQYKHHRWMLEKSQIHAYSLGDALDPSKEWWEGISIKERAVNFSSFRKNATFATLICEDLARLDPCHDVVRAIGPNLVIALLMDGAQIKGRWSERYAMGLSDDPGASVFAFTSLGLINRSKYSFKSASNNVGLWRDPINGTKELDIPEGHEALLMTLSSHQRTKKLLDGRSKIDQIWALSGVLPLSLNSKGKFQI